VPPPVGAIKWWNRPENAQSFTSRALGTARSEKPSRRLSQFVECAFARFFEVGRMYALGRTLQFLGLLILPIGIAGNLAESLTLWQSLSVSGVGVVVFYLGVMLQGKKE